jgi:hypothetical protein
MVRKKRVDALVAAVEAAEKKKTFYELVTAMFGETMGLPDGYDIHQFQRGLERYRALAKSARDLLKDLDTLGIVAEGCNPKACSKAWKRVRKTHVSLRAALPTEVKL